MAIIGYNTIGGSIVVAGDIIFFLTIEPTYLSTLRHQNAITQIYRYGYLGGVNHKASIYTRFANTIFVASTEYTTVVNPANWFSYLLITAFGVPFSMDAGDDHWIASWIASGGYGGNLYYDVGVDLLGGRRNQTYVAGTGFTGWPSPAGIVANTSLYSLYVTVEETYEVDVNNPIDITEGTTFALTPLHASVADQIDITEGTTFALTPLYASVADQINVTDAIANIVGERKRIYIPSHNESKKHGAFTGTQPFRKKRGIYS